MDKLLENRTEKPFGFKWPDDPVLALGIYFTYDSERARMLKVLITIFFYSLIRIYTSSNDVPRRNFLIPTKRDFFMIF